MSLRALSAGDSIASNLLVLLHGWGANAQDVAGIAPAIQLASYQMLFPDAPHRHQTSDGSMVTPNGRMWYTLPEIFDFNQPFIHQPDLQHSRQLLLDWLIELPKQTGIPLEKTVLGGFSQGGAMALDIGMQLPLAGMLILSGYCHGPLCAPSSPRAILLVHGRQDLVVPIAQAHRTKAELDKLSAYVDYHECNMGHEISWQVLELAKGFCERIRKNEV